MRGAHGERRPPKPNRRLSGQRLLLLGALVVLAGGAAAIALLVGRGSSRSSGPTVPAATTAPPVTTAPTSTTAPTPTTTVTTTTGTTTTVPVQSPVPGVGVLRYGDAWAVGTAYETYSYLVVTTNNASLAAAEPGKSLVYFSGTDVNIGVSDGVPHDQAAANGWLLKDAAGKLLVNTGYPQNSIGDVGNAEYQQAWLANVTAFLKAHGDKGVFIDDVLRDIEPLADEYPARYPNRSAWADAMLSFVKAVGPQLRADGYYVLVNASAYSRDTPGINDGSLEVDWWRQLAPYVSGLMEEYYQETSDGTNTLRASGSEWNQNWQGWQKLIATAQSFGKDFVGLTYGPAGDVQRMAYGRASFLLEWDGGGGAYIYEPPGDDTDPRDPAWTTGVGSPTAPKQEAGNGWLRKYSDGIVLVNPDPQAEQTFALGGDYVSPDGKTVNSVTLKPTTGMVLASTRPGAAP